MPALQDLVEDVKAVAPNLTGISIGDPADKATWKMGFAEGATQAERDAAQAVLDAFTVEQLRSPSRQEQRRAQIESDSAVADMMDKLRNASMAQIDTWLTNNVTNLAQARTVMAAQIKLMVIIASRLGLF